jgi:hypothetical protein
VQLAADDDDAPRRMHGSESPGLESYSVIIYINSTVQIK